MEDLKVDSILIIIFGTHFWDPTIIVFGSDCDLHLCCKLNLAKQGKARQGKARQGDARHRQTDRQTDKQTGSRPDRLSTITTHQ